MFESEIELIQTLIPLIIAVITAIIAYLENRKKKEALDEVNYQIGVNQIASEQINALVSPKDAKQDVVRSLPGRAWQMSDATKKFLTAGAFAPYTESILQQVKNAESQGLVSYTITIPNGVQYFIEYGLLKMQVGNS